jgi:hypothetical protein
MHFTLKFVSDTPINRLSHGLPIGGNFFQEKLKTDFFFGTPLSKHYGRTFYAAGSQTVSVCPDIVESFCTLKTK